MSWRARVSPGKAARGLLEGVLALVGCVSMCAGGACLSLAFVTIVEWAGGGRNASVFLQAMVAAPAFFAGGIGLFHGAMKKRFTLGHSLFVLTCLATGIALMARELPR